MIYKRKIVKSKEAETLVKKTLLFEISSCARKPQETQHLNPAVPVTVSMA